MSTVQEDAGQGFRDAIAMVTACRELIETGDQRPVSAVIHDLSGSWLRTSTALSGLATLIVGAHDREALDKLVALWVAESLDA